MRKIIWGIVILVVFVVGVVAGGLGMARTYQRVFIVDGFGELGFRAAEDVNILSSLRMGEYDAAIKALEFRVDNFVWTAHSWQGTPAGEVMPRKLSNYLQIIRMYRTLYPASGENAPTITAYLAQTPEPQQPPRCNSPICRLWTEHQQAKRDSTTAPSSTPR